MLNLRARDGAAFVMEIGDIKAAFERAGDDGPDLRRALKFRMAMQSDIGMPEDRVRLLTRPEAGALAGRVQSAAVEDRAARVAEVQDLYGPLFGRAMKELSGEGLDPRHRALAWARDNPALARTIANALEPGGAGPEQAPDPAGSQEVRGRLRDLTADARPGAEPEGEIADAVDAILSAAEALGVEYLRQTGRVEESAARAAAFANGAIEDARLAAADDEDDVRDMVSRREDPQGVVGPLGPARLIDEGSQDVQPLAEKADKGGDEDGSPLVGPGGEGQKSEKPGKSQQPPAVTDPGPAPQTSAAETKPLSPIFRKAQVDNDLAVDIALDFPTEKLTDVPEDGAVVIGGYLLDTNTAKRFAEVRQVTPETAAALKKKIAGDENLDAMQKGELVREIQRTLKGDPISRDMDREKLRERIGSLLEKLDVRSARSRALGQIFGLAFMPTPPAAMKPRAVAKMIKRVLLTTVGEVIAGAVKLKPRKPEPKN